VTPYAHITCHTQELAGRLGIKESELEAIFGTTQAALEDVMSLMQQIKVCALE
jgi:hypothetical protein